MSSFRPDLDKIFIRTEYIIYSNNRNSKKPQCKRTLNFMRKYWHHNQNIDYHIEYLLTIVLYCIILTCIGIQVIPYKYNIVHVIVMIFIYNNVNWD